MGLSLSSLSLSLSLSLLSPLSLSLCVVCVCVCVSGIPYIMTQDGNIQNPCGDIFGPHEENSLEIIPIEVCFFCFFVFFKSKIAKSFL